MWFLKYILCLCAFCMLPMLFWEKAKKSEYFGLLSVSVSIGEVCALLRNSNDEIFIFIIMAFIYTIGVYMAVIIILAVIQIPIKNAEKKFYDEKHEYYGLKDIDIDNITKHGKKRLEYLESRKKDFEGEFTPNRIRLDK